MKRFEYKETNRYLREDDFARLGQAGWELVSATDNCLYFKRELSEGDSESNIKPRKKELSL